jgi:hypothetical protein
MKDLNHLNHSMSFHFKTIKLWLEGEKIMAFFQKLGEYSVKYLGVSYMNNRTMAKEMKCSVRTIQRYIKQLQQINVLTVIPTAKTKNNGRTSNTIVILPILKEAEKEEKSDSPAACHGGEHSIKHSFNPSSLKQERDYYKDNQNKSENPPEEKIVQYISHRVKDAIKKGTTIKSLSAYIDKIFRSTERKAWAADEIEKNKKRQEENKRKQEIFREGFWGKAAAESAARSWRTAATKDELDGLGVY